MMSRWSLGSRCGRVAVVVFVVVVAMLCHYLGSYAGTMEPGVWAQGLGFSNWNI